MFCRNCGKELTGAPEICMNCGAKPMAGTSFCPGCGAPTTPSTEVCSNCGVQVTKAMKRKTWMPTAAGILCIVAGVLCVIPSIVVGWIFAPVGAPLIIASIIPIVGGIYALRRKIWGLALAGSICAVICAFVWVPIVFAIFQGLWALISLGGSDNPGSTPPGPLPDTLLYGPMIGLGILGILAIIFVIQGKREFK